MPIRKRFDPRAALPGSPFLTHVSLKPDRIQPGVHPFTLPWIGEQLDLTLTTPLTFLVGENGTGKSTLLEAIARACGFGSQGGNRDQSFAEGADGHTLGRALRLGWRQKVSGGFFLRAETFFNFASYLESVGSTFLAYGGKSLHHQSHGEAFLALFQHRFEDGLYLLDEPEAALSPQRQLAFLTILHELTAKKSRAIHYRHAFADASDFPRCHGPESRRRRDPTCQVPGYGSLSRDQGFSQCAGALLSTSAS